ncbi:MAG: hypothetical protein OXE43_06995 [Chloroflexi bacterium]|nr:hypothetical protein [Chloroflexota bacterium]
MPARPAAETARLGDEIYERDIRSRVEATHRGEVVAIDTDGGNWAIGETARVASERLLGEHPDADVWCVRVGYRALYSLGGGSLRSAE